MQITPIQLTWARPVDGVKFAESATGNPILEYVTEREHPVQHRLSNLEDPTAMRLVNATTNDALLAFVGRFGLLDRSGGQRHNFVGTIGYHRDQITELLTMTALPPDERIGRSNALLQYTVFKPTFEMTTQGQQRLVLLAENLVDFMFYECAVAIDVGAVLSACEHCNLKFLTGPLTGRRSHAKYCSDRCRVAAMRTRRSKNVAAEEVR